MTNVLLALTVLNFVETLQFYSGFSLCQIMYSEFCIDLCKVMGYCNLYVHYKSFFMI